MRGNLLTWYLDEDHMHNYVLNNIHFKVAYNFRLQPSSVVDKKEVYWIYAHKIKGLKN